MDSQSSAYTRKRLSTLKRNLSWTLKTTDLPFVLKIILSALIILLVLGLKFLINQFTETGTFLIFFPAIILNAWLFGFGSGVLSTIATLFFIDYFFSQPFYHLKTLPNSQLFLLMLFLVEGLAASKAITVFRKALKESELQRFYVIQNEKRFRLMIEGVKDYAIFFLNPDGFILNWNEGAQSITGYQQNEVIDKHISIFFSNEEVKARKPWNELDIAKSQGRFEDEVWRIKNDGSKFYAHVSVSPIFDDNGRLEGYVKIMHDMTEHKLQEQQKDNFISIASHELKTPITSIKAFIQLLQRSTLGIDSKNDLYLSRIDKQINKLTQLIDDLLDVSRISQGRLEYNEEVFPFDELVNEIIEEIRPISTKHKIIKRGKINTLVFADKYRVGQVLTNLLTNAIKYSPGNTNIIVSSAVEKNGVTLSVRDFGIGIPKNQREKVFNRFYRVHDKQRESYPGLGLGLYISAQIMKRHGGKLWFDSEVNKGSVFHFFLPITLRNKFRQDLKNQTPSLQA